MFDCLSTPIPADVLGKTARIEFSLSGRHHIASGRILHIQGLRAIVAHNTLKPELHEALVEADRSRQPDHAARNLSLQAQEACHARFMDGMKRVVDSFYQRLVAAEPAEHTNIRLPTIKDMLGRLRIQLTHQLTHVYPAFPVQEDAYADSTDELALVDLSQVDNWIRRSTLVQNLSEPYRQSANQFSLNYARLLQKPGREVTHPYQLEPVLNILDEVLAPYDLDANEQAFCTHIMGEAFGEHASWLYQQLLQIVGEHPNPSEETGARSHDPASAPPVAPSSVSLEQWLRSARHAAGTLDNDRPQSGMSGYAEPAPYHTDQLTTLLTRLTENLSSLTSHLPAAAYFPAGATSGSNSIAVTGYLPSGAAYGNAVQGGMSTLVPGLIARDRVFSHFLPEMAGSFGTVPPSAGDTVSAYAQPASASGEDQTALQNLQAYMRQPPAFDAGPERLTQASQIRTLMLQAQGLLLEYTLNGLTYQSQPDHPAWQLLNALDALHQGADNRGQFLDQALHQAIRLSMQWLLEQEDVDTALAQVNKLLDRINLQLAEERQARRTQHLDSLGTLEQDKSEINAGWCIVKLDDDLIPYEILGLKDGVWMLLDRSASDLLEVPKAQFRSALDAGEIQEAQDYDTPYLERIADATLTASLEAVHAYTWQDTSSGCLKRSALMDELERRLMHPVSSPPSFCALIEIPGMRPGMTGIPPDELTVLQKRTGDLLHSARLPGEQCGRLNDIAFMMVFTPQDRAQLKQRLATLKQNVEALHPQWKMLGAAVLLIEQDEATPSPASVLRRANMASATQRQTGGFDLSVLDTADTVSNEIIPLPFSALYLRGQKISPCDENGLPHYEILLGVSEDLVPAHTTQSFVVMAEQSGRVHELDAWVMENALRALSESSSLPDQISGLSVNLSGASLANPDHAARLLEILSAHTRLADKIIVEVTETAAIDNLEQAVQFLRKLRQLGLRVALDDFGSGYSSYAYLRTLPLDYLKIDGTYIRNIVNDKTDQALTASMVDVAHALGLKVIAEFVDNETAYQLLKEMGVDYVQGYWVHKPERLEQLLA